MVVLLWLYGEVELWLMRLVIFSKRATSIIPTNHPIYPHPKVTQALDYEGELAIIIGKGGLGIKKEDAWDHVWGATIINDASGSFST